MRHVHKFRYALALMLLSGVATLAYARHCYCHHCGLSGTCKKVCRLVCEDKKVEVVCWGAKCEEFCVPCRGTRCKEHCEAACTECHPEDNSLISKPKRFIWTEWLPTKATMYTRTKLMKKSTTKSVPTYNWVVEELCPHCQSRCEYAAIGPDIELPPVPPDGEVVLYERLPKERHPAIK